MDVILKKGPKANISFFSSHTFVQTNNRTYCIMVTTANDHSNNGHSKSTRRATIDAPVHNHGIRLARSEQVSFRW